MKEIADIQRAYRQRRWTTIGLLVGLILLPIIVTQIIMAFIPGFDDPDQPPMQVASWQPPGWVFAVVWTILYICMGVASFLIIAPRERFVDSENIDAIILYCMQLILNWSYSPVTFAARANCWGLWIIALMMGLVIGCLFTFRRINWFAGLLFLPYIAWLCIATALQQYVVDHNTCYGPFNNTNT